MHSSYKGKIRKITFYNPTLDQAKEFKKLGANWIHMVDIDGAFKGKTVIMKYL